MMRSLVLLVVGLSAVPAWAQSDQPPGDDRRFQLNKVEEGYVRLDLKSGQVSLCSRRTVGWACAAVPDERAALDAEIARLQSENATLKKALLDRGAPLPGGLKATPPGDGPVAESKRPSDAELDRMMSSLERVWRRLVEMMVNLQKDINKSLDKN